MRNPEKRKGPVSLKNGIYWAAALLPFAISLAFYNRLPDQIPTHWNMQNAVDGYSSRNMACFGIPALMLLFAAGINLAFKLDPKRGNIARSKEVMEISRWFIVLLAVLMQGIVVAAGLGYEVDVARIVSVAIALLVTALGNYLPRCRQNYTMGIKLPWTLEDEENWVRTHRLAGYVWMAGGILMAAAGYLRLFWGYMGIILAISLIPAVYSYWIYRKKRRG